MLLLPIRPLFQLVVVIRLHVVGLHEQLLLVCLIGVSLLHTVQVLLDLVEVVGTTHPSLIHISYSPLHAGGLDVPVNSIIEIFCCGGMGPYHPGG